MRKKEELFTCQQCQHPPAFEALAPLRWIRWLETDVSARAMPGSSRCRPWTRTARWTICSIVVRFQRLRCFQKWFATVALKRPTFWPCCRLNVVKCNTGDCQMPCEVDTKHALSSIVQGVLHDFCRILPVVSCKDVEVLVRVVHDDYRYRRLSIIGRHP